MENGGKLVQKVGLRMLVRFLIYIAGFPLLLFAASGRWDWGFGWLFYLLHVGFTLGGRLVVLRKNPDMLVERGTALQEGKGSPGDRMQMLVSGLLGPLVSWVLIGLDERYNWSPDLSSGVQWTGLALLVIGYSIATWAFVSNAFFSSVVRVQSDRGQQVIQSGPYAIVRHPGYASGMLAYLAIPLMLDSLWGLLPSVLTSLVIVSRTAREDRMLQEELPGYREYAQKTRYRLLPGVW